MQSLFMQLGSRARCSTELTHLVPYQHSIRRKQEATTQEFRKSSDLGRSGCKSVLMLSVRSKLKSWVREPQLDRQATTYFEVVLTYYY
jgi:hypothetical protein